MPLLLLLALLWGGTPPLALAASGDAAEVAAPTAVVDRASITEVVAAGPAWATFTNRDGTGLYHEILAEVFGLYGVPVRRVYVPSERALQLIADGQADMQTCYDRVPPPFVLGAYPMYENAFHVLFHKAKVPDWQGPESLRDRTIAGRIGYYSQENFSVPVKLFEVKSGEAALGMVQLGRADFYVDDEQFIRESLANSEFEFAAEEYAIEVAGYRSYHPVFAQSPRGQTIRAMYEEGMRTLHAAGVLRPIFAKWGYPYPRYPD